MNRFIKIIISLVTASAVIFTGFSVSAVSFSGGILEAYEKTEDLFNKYDKDFGFYISEDSAAKRPKFYYNSGDTDRVRPVFEEAGSFLREDVLTMTYEDIQNTYEKLREAIDSVRIGEEELSFIVDICENWINNENDYYNEEFWNSYTEQLGKTKQIIADYENSSPEDIKNAYWDLYAKFNEVCVYSTVPGDMNGDGKVTADDCTVLQSYLAGLSQLNASQWHSKFNIIDSWYCNVDHVTKLQQSLAHLTELEEGYNFTRVEENINTEDYLFNDIIHEEYVERNAVNNQ